MDIGEVNMTSSQYETKHHQHSHSDQDIVNKVAILSYFTIMGWLIALFIYGENKTPLARFHLRQSLGLTLTAALLSFIPLIGWLLNILVFFAWCMGLYSAICAEKKPLPIVGDFYQEHLDFI